MVMHGRINLAQTKPFKLAFVPKDEFQLTLEFEFYLKSAKLPFAITTFSE